MILTMLASDRSTVTPLSPPPHQGANRRIRHQPPANFDSCSTVARSTDTPRASCGDHKRDLRDPSPAPLGGCNGLRTRSLKLASNRANRHTLKAAPAAAILVSESGATGETKKAAQRFSAIGR